MKKIILIISCILLIGGGYAQSPRIVLSKEEIQEDIDYLKNLVYSIHPEPFYRTPEVLFVQKQKEIEANLPDSLDSYWLYFKLAPWLSMLKDGHTSVFTPNFSLVEYIKNGGKIFPLKIELEGRKMYAVYNYKKDEAIKKIQITKINHRNIDSILNTLINLYPYEKKEDIYYSSIERNFYEFVPFLYGTCSEFIFETPDRPENKFVVSGLSPQEFWGSTKKQSNGKTLFVIL